MIWDQEIESYSKLRDAIEDSGGILTIRAVRIRDIESNSRLKVNVRARISNELEREGIKHWADVPANQNEPMTVFLKNSRLGALVELLDDPGADTAEEVLAMLEPGRSDAILAKIRKILKASE